MRKFTITRFSGDIKKISPYLIAIIIFYLVTAIYFFPLIQGKSINQSDISQLRGATNEIAKYKTETGKVALWTNAMFGGMPTYQISIAYKKTALTYIQNMIRLGLPRIASFVFLYFLGFYFLLLVLRINPWLAIVGALAYGFSSYFFIILEVGHNTKAEAIAYMAPLFAGIILTYNRKWLIGFIITAIFAGLEIKANHFQITYYLLIFIFFFAAYEFFESMKSKTIIPFFKSTTILFIAAIFAVALNLPGLWSTYEFSKDTIRGKSELKNEVGEIKTGLSKDYITRWSYGIDETLTLMVPNAKGGATRLISENPEALQRVDRGWRQDVGMQNQYWGDQPGTSGPVYVGAIVIFFFVFGLFVIKGKYKWLLLMASVISILLSWGKNFMPLTDFFIAYMPLYGKFRAVTMILVIAEFCIPLLAFLTINKLINTPGLIQEKKKQLFLSFGLTGGLLLIFYLFPAYFFTFLSNAEIEYFNNISENTDAVMLSEFIGSLESVRIYIFRSDTMRSILYISAAFILLFLYGYKKLNTTILISGIGILILLDMVPVNRRFLNSDKYVRTSTFEKPAKPTIADSGILKDTSVYRVFNLAVDTYQETSTSYYHHSIGGYTAAKLRRYQELIEYNIKDEGAELINTLRKASGIQEIIDICEDLTVLNMLNTKYIIFNPNAGPIQNPHALGNAWFVENYNTVKDANEEINALKAINPSVEAIFDQKFSSLLDGVEITYDSAAAIKLVSYEPNQLIYQSESKTNQFAVFSEIYYDKGWNVYIDGVKSEYLRANYSLRAMVIPAGNHQIEFRFEPQSYYLGNTISSIVSLLLILLFLGVIVFELKKRNHLLNGNK